MTPDDENFVFCLRTDPINGTEIPALTIHDFRLAKHRVAVRHMEITEWIAENEIPATLLWGRSPAVPADLELGYWFEDVTHAVQCVLTFGHVDRLAP